MSAAGTPECLACGACCFGQTERYVPVTGADHARLGDHADELTVFIGNRCYMRMREVTMERGGHAPSPPGRQSRQGPTPPRDSLRSQRERGEHAPSPPGGPPPEPLPRDAQCAALHIDPAGRFTCSVYALRPAVCRELERGSAACEAERARKGELRTRALLRVLHE